MFENGRNVELRTSQSDNKDEWYFVGTYDSTFVAIPAEIGHDHDGSFEYVQNSLNNMGYTSNRTETIVDSTECLTYIASSRIFYIRSHGSKTDVTLNSEDLTISDINSLETNALENCDLVLYGVCSAGEGREGANNLVNKTQEKGAVTVIGFDRMVLCFEVNMWATAFFEALENGETIEEACISADNVVSDEWDGIITTNSWYIAGSKVQTLN